MATVTLRPTSGSGTEWSNIAYAYDTSTGTEATVKVSSSTYSSRTATFNFDTSEIPSNATINSAILTINRMGSSANRIILYADINGDSSSRVINSSCLNIAEDTTADVTSYISNLNSIKLTGYTSSSTSYTLSIYDIYIDVNYTESTSGEGTTGKNILHINSNNDWGYVVETISNQTYTGSEGEGGGNEEPTQKIQNFIIGDKTITELYIGEQEIKEIYLGDNLLFEK